MEKKLIRSAILKEAISLAPFEGWTEPMLKRATARAGLSEADLTRSFQTVLDAIDFWSAEADAALMQHAANLNLAEMKVRERIAALVMWRLQYHASDREALRRAVHHLMLPWNATLNLRILTHTVDVIWKLAGDKSHDYNWYTKRLLLAGVFSSTLAYWLNDHSDDCSDTKTFLHHRIDDVLKVGSTVSRIIKKVA